MEKPPTSYDKIQFFPISGTMAGWSEEAPLVGPYQILPSENLTVENVSHLITESTFSLWKNAAMYRNTPQNLWNLCDLPSFIAARRTAKEMTDSKPPQLC